MPAAALLLPLAVLASGAVLAWIAGLLRVGASLIAAAAIAAALAALVLVWAAQREPLELILGDVGAGIRLGIRLDAISFAFALLILFPAAFLAVFVRPAAPALTVLATATSLLTVLASGLLFASLAWGATFTAVTLLLRAGGGEVSTRSRLRGGAAWLCLAWAAAALFGRAGTDQYTAIPVTSLQGAVFSLVALAAVFGSGLFPWRPWPAELWHQLRPRTAGPAIPVLYYAGFYFLVRMYQAGGGHYPFRAFNYLLVALGAAAALGAALRAQSVADRAQYFGEALPMGAGFALMALGFGTPLGLAAAIATLATTSLLAALLPLLAEAELSGSVALGLLVTAGLPPGAVFATRLLDLQAGLEANEVMGYLTLAGAAAWVIGIAAAARAMWLPAQSGQPAQAAGGRAPGLAGLLLGVLIAIGGAAVGLLQATVAVPAAAAAVSFPASALTGVPVEIGAASGSWPAVALGGLLAVILLIGGVAGRRSLAFVGEHSPAGGGRPDTGLGPPSQRGAPGPAGKAVHPVALLAPAWADVPAAWRRLRSRLAVPAEFRITQWSQVDAAMNRGSIWLWLALFALLAYLVVGR